MPATVWTIGHSTRSLEEFVRVLEAYDLEAVADVRRFPGSRRLPHFGSAALEQELASRQISYVWLPALGGRRRTPATSATPASAAWRNASFGAYAEYLGTEEFAGGLAELLGIACGLRTAIMCAEVLWWRCHRRLIADVLVSLGWEVCHIRDASAAEQHRIMPPARFDDGILSYSAER